MDRRAFLATAAAVTAGCGQAGSSGTPTDGAGTATDTPAESPTDTPTETPTAAPPSVQVTDVSAPSGIEIGTNGTLSVTLENAGGREGQFSAPVEARIGTGAWATTGRTVSAAVPAGESVTETVDLPPNDHVEPASYRLAEADPVARTRFVARELSLGEAHTLPNGVALSVEAAEFAEAYTYEGEDGETTLAPTDGEKWAVGTLRAENTADETARAPLISDIALFRGEQEFSHHYAGDNRDRYRGGDLAAGAVSEGDLPTDVPLDADRSDLRVEYSEALDDGRVTVRWSLTD
ncbi:DUF4352 domain-containing protein [Halosimplex halophilum]|uniref:hypothetical protein n=1 Tax=Halosimplex halophilum TaxID=2559572 RepID=UPI00107F5B3E|nr:hypothetical protein [Halosimplex halophilum]